GIVRVRAFGTYDFRIVEPKLFLREVAGTDDHFRLEEFNDTMRSRLVSVFSDAVATAKIPVLDVATRFTELGEALLPLINPALQSTASPAAGAAGMPDLLSPADVAKALGVSEEDVMAILSSGELKGKKIGSTYRITRAALDEFLKS